MVSSEKSLLFSQPLTPKQEIVWESIQTRILRILEDALFSKTKDEIIQEFFDAKKKPLYPIETIESVLLRLTYEGKIQQSFNRFSLPRVNHKSL